MLFVGEVRMVIGSTLAAIACHGCIGTAANPDYASPVSAGENVVVISDGIRLATSGINSGGGTAPSTFSKATPVAIGGEVSPMTGPLRAMNVSYRERSTVVAPWQETFATKSAKSATMGIAWSNVEAVQSFQGSRDAARMLNPGLLEKDFNAEFAFAAPRGQTGLAFDVNLVPSVSYIEEGEFETRSVGAEVRVGRDFDQRGLNSVADSWYVFAGTEGEALVWEAGEYGLSNMTGAMALRDQVTVGDLQAGISVQRGQGQLSFSYIRREVEWSDRNGGASEHENFAGVSFTFRR